MPTADTTRGFTGCRSGYGRSGVGVGICFKFSSDAGYGNCRGRW